MRGHGRKGTGRTLVTAVLAATWLAWGCGGSSDAPPNLLLITIDTTRADRLGCYGNADGSTPNLDRMASEGVLFEQAIAVAPITLPSHVSLLTGQLPPQHGVRLNGDYRLPEAGVTLAEHLADQEYATGAVVGAYVLSADFGLAQGFDTYDEPAEGLSSAPAGQALRHYVIVERPAEEVTDAALEWLDGRLSEPFFLWLHYFDPHADYAPPEPFASRFEEHPYDGEIAYVDAEVGRLFDALRAGGRLDRTLVAVTSDHGESLGEHGESTHGLFVYDATLRVPLLLRLPEAIPAGARSDQLVSGVDLAPTLLDLLGQPPLADVDGISFARAASGEALSPREPVYAEAELPLRSYGWAALRALRSGDRKFIEAPQRELYDLANDPGETTDLAEHGPDELRAWAQQLAALEADWPAEVPEAVQIANDGTRQRLGALGYVTVSVEPPRRAQRPDPKRLVQLHNLLLDAQALVARGALPQAQELLQKALASDPSNPTALEMSGTVACSTNQCDVGVEQLAAAARVAPHRYSTQRNLGNALHLAGRHAEAAEAYRSALALRPRSVEDHYALGNVLYAQGDVAGATASYDEAARLGLDTASFHAARGVARAAAGEIESARAALRQAVEADPELVDAWNQLGILSEKEGRWDEAREFYGRALTGRPTHVGALFNDAKVCLRLGLLDDAEASTERLIEAHPRFAPGQMLEAQIRLARGDEPAARRALERLLAMPEVDPRLSDSAREILQRIGK